MQPNFYIGFNNPFTKLSQTARILNIGKGRTFNARPGSRCGEQQKPPYTVLSLSIKITCKGVIFRHESVVLLTPKQDVLFIYEDFTLRQTLEKWSNQRFATIPVLKRNGEYLGTMTEGDILWGIKSIHGLDIDASEDIPIASFPRRRDYKAVPVTTDMHALLNAAVDQNFVPVVDDRNVFIGIVRRTAILQQVAKDYESPKGNVFPENTKSKARKEAAFV